MPDPQAEWIVFRFSDDMPESYRPPDLDGLWMPADQAPRAQSIDAARKAAESHENEHLVGECVAVPTDRFETRQVDTGALRVHFPTAPEHDYDVVPFERAQVYEIRPLWKVDESW